LNRKNFKQLRRSNLLTKILDSQIIPKLLSNDKLLFTNGEKYTKNVILAFHAPETRKFTEFAIA